MNDSHPSWTSSTGYGQTLSLPIVPFRQRREGTHSLILPRRGSSGPLELGVKLIRGHPKLECEGPVENLGQHIGRLVHVDCADNKKVPWQRQPLRFYITQDPLTGWLIEGQIR